MPTRFAQDRTVRHGLGRWLALAFSLLSVLVTAVLVMVGERDATGQVRASIGANLAELANQTTSRLDRSMFERWREVRMMAERLGGETDLELVRGELEAMQRTYSDYAWIGLTDTRGKVLAATGGLLTGADVSQRDWFRNALRGVTVGDVHEAKLLAKLLPSNNGEPLRFVDIAFPVRAASGELIGILCVHLSWQWARDVEQSIFLPVGRSRTVEPLIVSEKGVVLLGPSDVLGDTLTVPSIEAAAGGAGWVKETWADGRTYLVGHARDQGHRGYPGLGWRVLVRQDAEEAYAPVRALQQRMLLWGLVIAALFSLLGWWVARIITRPLIGLAGAARRLESGEAVPVEVRGPYSEVAFLGAAFNSLVTNLQQKESDLRELNATLERRVEKRTAELQEALGRVQENVERVRTIIELAPDPFVGTDFQGRITDWNSQAEALLGWRREEVLGRELADVLVPARFAEGTRATLRGFAITGRSGLIGQTIERIVVDRHGREIEVEVRIGLIDRGKLKLLSAFLHDISRRKEIERMKDEFVATVSHELRTPLTAIYGSLGLLEGGVAGPLSDQARALVRMSNQSCERLIRLVNDVLDVEKIAAGRIEYARRRQPLQPLVEQAMRDTRPFAEGHGVALRQAAAAEAEVDADGDRIVQVLVNLISNAAKFSPRGAEVTVTAQVQDGRVRVTVTDTGPGVPASFRPRVFERFAQADASDRKLKGGTGLGLNICRSIVQAHGGTIDFDSRPGHTAFWFELPLA